MKRKWITASIAAGLLAGFTGIAASQEIALGYLPSSGGPFATFSKTNLIAAEMALEEINAAGGVGGKKLKLISFDTAGKPDQAVVGLRKLAEDDKVLAVVGPFSSSEVRVVFPAAERAGVASMSMASSAPNLAEPYKFAFRNTTDEGFLFERVLRALKDKGYPMGSASIAYATDDVVSKTMGENVLPALMKKAGIDPKASVTFQSQAFDLAPQVSQLNVPADRSDRRRFGSGSGDAPGAGNAPPGPQGPPGRGLDHRRSGIAEADGQGRRRHRDPDRLLCRPQRPHQEVRSRIPEARQGRRHRPLGVRRSSTPRPTTSC